MDEELVTLVWHIGWLHIHFREAATRDLVHNVIKEMDSDDAALLRKMLVNDIVEKMTNDGKLTQEQIEETYDALHNRQWWFTIGDLDMNILHGVDTTKTPYERWLAASS